MEIFSLVGLAPACFFSGFSVPALSPRFLRGRRWGFEVDLVAVRVGQVSDERSLSLDPARGNLAVDGEGVFTDEVDGYALAHFPRGRPGIVPLVSRVMG
ncbi:MAG: hypothetical protein DMG77_04030 [Acidobacteria bacterium]|nr:MAG: hypothetical protein DMG77_04030 [Acidobacteriota bacterium]